MNVDPQSKYADAIATKLQRDSRSGLERIGDAIISEKFNEQGVCKGANITVNLKIDNYAKCYKKTEVMRFVLCKVIHFCLTWIAKLVKLFYNVNPAFGHEMHITTNYKFDVKDEFPIPPSVEPAHSEAGSFVPSAKPSSEALEGSPPDVVGKFIGPAVAASPISEAADLPTSQTDSQIAQGVVGEIVSRILQEGRQQKIDEMQEEEVEARKGISDLCDYEFNEAMFSIVKLDESAKSHVNEREEMNEEWEIGVKTIVNEASIGRKWLENERNYAENERNYAEKELMARLAQANEVGAVEQLSRGGVVAEKDAALQQDLFPERGLDQQVLSLGIVASEAAQAILERQSVFGDHNQLTMYLDRPEIREIIKLAIKSAIVITQKNLAQIKAPIDRLSEEIASVDLLIKESQAPSLQEDLGQLKVQRQSLALGLQPQVFELQQQLRGLSDLSQKLEQLQPLTSEEVNRVRVFMIAATPCLATCALNCLAMGIETAISLPETHEGCKRDVDNSLQVGNLLYNSTVVQTLLEGNLMLDMTDLIGFLHNPFISEILCQRRDGKDITEDKICTRRDKLGAVKQRYEVDIQAGKDNLFAQVMESLADKDDVYIQDGSDGRRSIYDGIDGFSLYNLPSDGIIKLTRDTLSRFGCASQLDLFNELIEKVKEIGVINEAEDKLGPYTNDALVEFSNLARNSQMKVISFDVTSEFGFLIEGHSESISPTVSNMGFDILIPDGFTRDDIKKSIVKMVERVVNKEKTNEGNENSVITCFITRNNYTFSIMYNVEKSEYIFYDSHGSLDVKLQAYAIRGASLLDVLNNVESVFLERAGRDFNLFSIVEGFLVQDRKDVVKLVCDESKAPNEGEVARKLGSLDAKEGAVKSLTCAFLNIQKN